MKLIFSDIDGVLNRNPDFDSTKFTLDPDLVGRLDRICSSPDSYLVITSRWRLYTEREDMADKLRCAGFTSPFLGYTKDGDDRSQQILETVSFFRPESWVVIDDRFIHGFNDNLVLTSGMDGINDSDVSLALNILSK